ncbi:MAG: hypothetical protein IT560_06015 [Alphaproteobacteria bacterium]|nr:hypothetical protein [Alphaproteobacteria bacterium]
MKNPIQTLKSGLRNTFNYVVHGEGTDARARKPEAIAALVAISTPAFEASAGEGYVKKLEGVLKEMRTKDIETLAQNNIAVGFDARIAEQNRKSEQKPINATFYSLGKDGGMLALPDFGEKYAPYSAKESLESMARKLRDGDTFPAGQTLYAGTLTAATMRTVTTYTAWFVPERFPEKTLKANPALQQPPKPRA